ncbi:MAG: ATP-binding protein [Candidatus Dormibacteraeota bacterium]|nr:ATP-binding protein [Candidatus Dormibacteraeota bacterium]
MVESAPAYFYVADPSNASTIYRSPQAVSMLGHSLADWSANPSLWAEILHPADRDRVLTEITAAMKGLRPFRSEYRIRTRSGTYLWVRDHGTLVVNPTGPGMIFQGVVLDITEEMEAVQDSLRIEERLAALLRSAPVILFSLTPAGIITVAGGSGLADLELGPDHGVGRSVFDVFADQPEFVHGFQAALAGRETSGEVLHEGLGRWFAAGATPVFENGQLMAVTIVATDITDRRAYQQALFESQAKSRALASMSHELRTPLNSILGFSQLLQAGTIAGELNDRQRRYVDNVVKSGEHLLDLVNDVLDLAKSESGQVELELESVVLDEAVARALSTVRPLADAKGLSLSQEASAGSLVRADPQRLHQVLLNLLSNAIKFTEVGEVAISSNSAEEGWVSVTVADTGIGISAADQAVIFDEFVQLGSGWADGQRGTGLGLSLTRSFVEAMGGTIWTISEPGGGSRFTFRLAAPA